MQLADMRLEAYKGDKKVTSRKTDADLLELTKQFRTNKAYIGGALKTWNKLVELSGLSVNKRSKKHQQQAPEIKYYKSPDKLCCCLEILIASKEDSNESVALNNEIVEIVDRLFVDGVIFKKEYRKIHNYVE